MITFTNLTPYAGEKATEVGWYVLGEDQQQVGPYAFSELRGELFASLSDTIIFFLIILIYIFQMNRVATRVWSCIYFDFVVRYYS